MISDDEQTNLSTKPLVSTHKNYNNNKGCVAQAHASKSFVERLTARGPNMDVLRRPLGTPSVH